MKISISLEYVLTMAIICRSVAVMNPDADRQTKKGRPAKLSQFLVDSESMSEKMDEIKGTSATTGCPLDLVHLVIQGFDGREEWRQLAVCTTTLCKIASNARCVSNKPFIWV